MRSLDGRKRTTAFVAAGVVAGMVGLSYASVPLYRLFCQVTGFGGTTQVAKEATGPVGERTITVRFDAGTAGGMPWDFRPAQREIRVRIGEEALAFYEAVNPTARAIVGNATYNVTPDKAGRYFSKIACFCFTEQRLEAGQSVDMPVSFFVDPSILEDRKMDDVTTITLSYTFFEDRQAVSAVAPRPARGGGEGRQVN